MNAGLAPQVINNSANYAYNDGVGNVGPFPTNLAPFTVNQSVSLTFTGQTIASATQGATLSYTNTLTNTGNGTDCSTSWSARARSRAARPTRCTRATASRRSPTRTRNGIPDTGPVAAGASTNVVLQVQLPPAQRHRRSVLGRQDRDLGREPARSTATATDVLTAIDGERRRRHQQLGRPAPRRRRRSRGAAVDHQRHQPGNHDRASRCTSTTAARSRTTSTRRQHATDVRLAHAAARAGA